MIDLEDFDLPEPIYRLKVMEKGDTVSNPAAAAPPPGEIPSIPAAEDSAVDVTRDTHLEREVAKERAEMPDSDLLTPNARRE